MGDDPSKRWPSRLTPMSSRAAIVQGAQEIAVDDFIDSHLAERPPTNPPAGGGQQTRGHAIRPTQRGLGPGASVPPQGASVPPQGGFAPPQGASAPPQGGFAPPQGGFEPDTFRDVDPLHPEPITTRKPSAAPMAWAPAAPPRPGNTAPPRPDPLAAPPPVRPVIKTVPLQMTALSAQMPGPPAPPPPPDDDEGGGSTMMLTPEQAEAAAAAVAQQIGQRPASAPPHPPTGMAGTIMMQQVHEGSAVTPAPFIAPAEPYGEPPPPQPAQADGRYGYPPPPQAYGAPASPAQGYAASGGRTDDAPYGYPPPPGAIEPPKRKGAGLWVGFAIGAVVIGGATFAVMRGHVTIPGYEPSTNAAPADTARARATSAQTGDARAASTATQAQGDGRPTAAPTVTTDSAAAGPSGAPRPSGEPSAVPPTPSASPTATPSEPSSGPSDGTLLSFQGHLTVTSSTDAEVVVHGQSAGRTNERLLVRCGSKNVRLRKGASEWLSPGQHVHVVCMQHTKVTIDPSP